MFRMSGDEYIRLNRGMSFEQHRAFRAITMCRTAELGGHIYRCDNCGAERISYNSCRNRHCPKCQFLRKEKWLLARERDLLPIPYFHVVFTMPAELNPVVWQNKGTLFNLFFRCVSLTLMSAAARRFQGAKIGFICILHTWSQTLLDHPHIHCIVTGGGLAPDRKKWISSGDSFFVHVRALSRLFRGKFLSAFKQLALENRLSFNGRCAGLREPAVFQDFIDGLHMREWVVYCKEPFGDPKNLINYLGRYTHRVAIANHRILDLDAEHVSFQYRDYADGKKMKIMRLSNLEFIRRFLLHILPGGFMKIRHYGLLANRNRRVFINICRNLLNFVAETTIPDYEGMDWKTLLRELTGLDVDRCEECRVGIIVYIGPLARPP